jgi:hypothetical protein
MDQADGIDAPLGLGQRTLGSLVDHGLGLQRHQRGNQGKAVGDTVCLPTPAAPRRTGLGSSMTNELKNLIEFRS